MNNENILKDKVYRLINLFRIFDPKLLTINFNLEYDYPHINDEMERMKVLFYRTFETALDKISAVELICHEYNDTTGYSFEEIDEDSGEKFKTFLWHNMVRYDILISKDEFDNNDGYYQYYRNTYHSSELDENGVEIYNDEHTIPGFDEKTEKFVMELYEQIKLELTNFKREVEGNVYSINDSSSNEFENDGQEFDPKIHSEGVDKFMKILNEIDKKNEYEYSFTSEKDWRYFSKVLFCFYNNLKMDESRIRITLNEGSKTRFYGLNLGIRKTLRKGKPLTSDFQFQQIMIDYIDHGTPLTTEQFYEKIKGLSKSLQMPGKTSSLLKELKGQMT